MARDEPAVRGLARRILEVAGYRVIGAANGIEALRVCEQATSPVDLLLTDVVMPQMSGRHLAESLSSLWPAMRVLYMSGYTADAIVHHGVLDPGAEFIGKPFTASELSGKVRKVLDGGVQ
jgi:DNA-binding response OmpR family regulator